ncbi:MAG: DUF4190 domain-containing protein [Microthrixaceae bacterium]
MSMPGGPGGFSPPPGGGMVGGASSEQDATIALVTGILGIVCCGPAAIAALFFGNKVRNDSMNPKQNLGNIGFILGIIGVALWILGTVYWVVS